MDFMEEREIENAVILWESLEDEYWRDYEPTWDEMEAEGLLQLWCDSIESGHCGMAAWRSRHR